MSRWRKRLVAFLVVLMLLGTSVVGLAAGTAKNVIFFIGDGMGLAQRTLLYYYLGHQPVMNQMDVVGLYTTHMADGYVTDSAASGTAMSTGVKTYDGAIGVDANKQPVRTILEAAKEAGKATGLVATVRISHATPAAFAAHNESRNNYEAIMVDILENEVDVLFGGGKAICLPEDLGGTRKDGRNLMNEFAARGYTIVNTPSEMALATELPVVGLFTPSDMTPEIDRDPAKEPSLAEMTRKAINLLAQNEEGFFLMVEGSQVDYACHDNDAVRAATEALALDYAIAEAMAFAAKNPDTLVVVAADHETGALAIGKGYQLDPLALREIRASYGQIASAVEESDDLVGVVMKYTGIELTEEEVALIENADSLARGITDVLNDRVGVIFGSGDHSAVMLPLTAHGAEAELFGGVYDNTDIPKRIAEAMG
ncbi:MAG: alkaline phosphatase, partial [Firmicutes bacterium]|nr:alkaline phosphatase [Bacillota bacterium]